MYQSRSALPAELKTMADQIEQGYLETAKKKAAFSTQCEVNEIKAEVIEYGDGAYRLPGRGSIFVVNDVIKSIGIEACGTRITYIVFCGLRNRYSAEVWDASLASCEVYQENERQDSEDRERTEAFGQ